MEIEQNNNPHLICGIDPGVNTGFAIFNTVTKELELFTFKLHKAFDKIRDIKGDLKHVVIENPNLWTHFSNKKDAMARKQGAGSVKRDFKAWADFLEDEKIEFKDLKPDKHRNSIAYNIDLFKRTTKYEKKCSEHARVAAMLVFKN